jgi:hypothetical protein
MNGHVTARILTESYSLAWIEVKFINITFCSSDVTKYCSSCSGGTRGSYVATYRRFPRTKQVSSTYLSRGKYKGRKPLHRSDLSGGLRRALIPSLFQCSAYLGYFKKWLQETERGQKMSLRFELRTFRERTGQLIHPCSFMLTHQVHCQGDHTSISNTEIPRSLIRTVLHL